MQRNLLVLYSRLVSFRFFRASPQIDMRLVIHEPVLNRAITSCPVSTSAAVATRLFSHLLKTSFSRLGSGGKSASSSRTIARLLLSIRFVFINIHYSIDSEHKLWQLFSIDGQKRLSRTIHVLLED